MYSYLQTCGNAQLTVVSVLVSIYFRNNVEIIRKVNCTRCYHIHHNDKKKQQDADPSLRHFSLISYTCDHLQLWTVQIRRDLVDSSFILIGNTCTLRALCLP